MQYRVLKGCVGPYGKPIVVDDIIDIPESDAKLLLRMGRLEPYVAPQEAVEEKTAQASDPVSKATTRETGRLSGRRETGKTV